MNNYNSNKIKKISTMKIISFSSIDWNWMRPYLINKIIIIGKMVFYLITMMIIMIIMKIIQLISRKILFNNNNSPNCNIEEKIKPNPISRSAIFLLIILRTCHK